MTAKKTPRAPAPKNRSIARPATAPYTELDELQKRLLQDTRRMIDEAMGIRPTHGTMRPEPQTTAVPAAQTALEAAVHENHLALAELRDMVGSLVGRLERTVLTPGPKQDSTNMASAGFPAQGGSPVVHALAGLQCGILEVRYQVQSLVDRLEA